MRRPAQLCAWAALVAALAVPAQSLAQPLSAVPGIEKDIYESSIGRYPNLTCFGNISTITLHRGTRDDVIAECRDNAEAALELGGVFAGVSNQVVPLAPIENVVTMIETLAEYH